MAAAIIMFSLVAAYADESAITRAEFDKAVQHIDQRLDDIAKQVNRLDDMSDKIADLWGKYYRDQKH
jgi:phage terminase Nu1 subunit (DNA packaging protein)